MNSCRQISVPAGVSAKKELLRVTYNVYSRWTERFPLACKKGCGVCCTRSVTMTSLEGEAILDFVRIWGRQKWLYGKLARMTSENGGSQITTNQFAEACLAGQEIDGEGFGSWDFRPCIFLEGNLCSIYDARPFSCRSFASFVECTADTAAEIAPIHLAVNTVFTQIIEHIASDGGTWGTMGEMLHCLARFNSRATRRTHLLKARLLPGFLLDDRELDVVNHLLQQLYQESGGNRTFGDLIDNFMPI